MSTIYITEPATKGKVLLKTTLGDIDIELWAKETPKACRNFVQLCLEGYYDNTIFHRVIKNFIAQGGDPTGTGEGGESIYGEPFPDEFHSRLRFNRRGLVAMASSGPCTNQSQFFFTLDKTEDLQRKHTIFGKITGDTVFNVLRMNDFEVDENDRPAFPAKIISTEVLWNPFDDIIPRELPKKVAEAEVVKEVAKPAKKNFALLSFGEEEENIEQESIPTGIKSSHQFPSKMLEESMKKRKEAGLEDDVEASAYLGSSSKTGSSGAQSTESKAKELAARKAANKLRRPVTEDEEGEKRQEEDEEDEEEEGLEGLDFAARMRAKLLAKRKKYEPDAPKKVAKLADSDSDDDSDDDKDANSLAKQADDAYRRKEGRLYFKKPIVLPDGTPAPRQKVYKGKLTENSIAASLDRFKKALKETPTTEDDEWKNHSLAFVKEPNRIDPMKRGEGETVYEVYDPLKPSERHKYTNAKAHERRLHATKRDEKW